MVETHAGRRAGWLGVDQFVGGGTTVRGALSARRHLAVVTSRAIDQRSATLLTTSPRADDSSPGFDPPR